MTAPAPRATESLSIVVPVFNEAESIEEVIADLTTIFDSVPRAELVVVDDHSTDETPDALASIAAGDARVRIVTQPRNRGHGPALVAGIEKATGTWLLLVDADGHIAAAEFLALWSRRASADLLMGSRVGRAEHRHRRALSRVLRSLASRLARTELADPNVPFKLLRRELWEDLRPFIPADAATPSLLLAVGAALRGWRIQTLPVRHRPRPNRRSKLPVARLVPLGARATVELLAFRRRVLSAAPRRDRQRDPELSPTSSK